MSKGSKNNAQYGRFLSRLRVLLFQIILCSWFIIGLFVGIKKLISSKIVMFLSTNQLVFSDIQCIQKLHLIVPPVLLLNTII